MISVRKRSFSFFQVTDPDGHCFIVTKGNGSFITKVVLHVSDLNQSISYWQGILRMCMVEKTEEKAIFAFGENQVILTFTFYTYLSVN